MVCSYEAARKKITRSVVLKAQKKALRNVWTKGLFCTFKSRQDYLLSYEVRVKYQR